MEYKKFTDGKSYRAKFAKIIRRYIQDGKWISNSTIMSEFLAENSHEDINNISISKHEGYSDLKKTIAFIKKFIITREGKESIEENGNNRCKSFRYTGKNDDPLSELANAVVTKDMKRYKRFCQNSAGFFPMSWLEYFFKDSLDILDIKDKKLRGSQVVSTSLDRVLTNISLLPKLFDAIENKQVLDLKYKPFDRESVTFIFHPHYLKEFNGRWFCMGHAHGMEPEFGFNIPIDRIEHDPCVKQGVEYVSPPPMFYVNYFKNIIGVSHLNDNTVYDVVIRVHTNYMFRRTETKPLHASQTTVLPYQQYEDGCYGEFSLHVELNKELIGRIMQMGPELEVMSPANIREIVSQQVKKLADLYGIT